MATGLQRLVRRAVLTKLKADASLVAIVPASSIYSQHVPQGPIWPFIRLGPSNTQRFRAACVDGAVVTFDVHAFARDRFTAGAIVETAEDHASRIGSAIERALGDNWLALEGSGKVRVRLSDIALMQDAEEAGAFHWMAQVNGRVLA